jgi:hypothetical protein
MLRMEDFRMRRAPLGGARDAKDAGTPVGGRLPSSTLRRANKRLMETHPNSKLEPTNWDHSHLKFLIATALPFFTIGDPDSNRQLETIRNCRKLIKIMQMTFSNRPKIMPCGKAPSNRSYRRLEINISPTKQRTEVLSNRP